MLIRLFVCLIFTIPAVAQKKDSVLTWYYAGGILAKKIVFIDSNTYYRTIYHLNGLVEITGKFVNEEPVGLSECYDKQGRIAFTFDYTGGYTNYSFVRYWKNGNVNTTGTIKDNEKFGIFCTYLEDGDLKWREDFNKNRLVMVRKQYSSMEHLRSKPYYTRINKNQQVTLSTMEGKTRKLKSGVLTYLKFKDQDSLYCHYFIHGSLNDTLVTSKFNYDITDNGVTLKFDSICLVPISRIAEVNFITYQSKKGGALLAGLITGLSLITLQALILPPDLYGPPSYLSSAAMAVAAYHITDELKKKHSSRQYTRLKYNKPGSS